MKTAPLCSLFAVLIGAVAGAAADPKPDREALIGTWKIVAFHDDGGDKLSRLGVSPAPKGKPPRVAKLVVTADEIFVLRGDGTRDVLAGLTNCAWKSYTLNEKASPKTIDLLGVPGKEGGKPKTYFGIYELAGDKLKICWNETPKGNDPAKVRPTKFKSDGDMNLFVCEKLLDTPEKPKE